MKNLYLCIKISGMSVCTEYIQYQSILCNKQGLEFSFAQYTALPSEWAK